MGDRRKLLISLQEGLDGDVPSFGISFVDTATGSFHLTEFVDDAELTRFETFVAQIRPKELILEKVGYPTVSTARGTDRINRATSRAVPFVS